MLLCLHEETAVAIAHGYAKVTGKAMAAAVHSNVGLFHATMAIFNAWCDRMPVLVLGATGPVDAAKRRPWIDSIHTAARPGRHRARLHQMGRPAGLAGRRARGDVARATWLANSAPQGPVYIDLDAEMQEAPLRSRCRHRRQPLHAGNGRGRPGRADRRPPRRALQGAERPMILAGRVSRDPRRWQQRVALAEAIGARVHSLKVGAAFPTDHPLHVDAPQALHRGRD